MNREIPKRFSILHAFYNRGAAVQHWFAQRIRPAGAACLMVVCFAAFMSIGQPKDSIFQVFCFSLGLLTLGFCWVLFRSAKLRATHRLPNHATVGEPVNYSIMLENAGTRKIRSILLTQIPPDPRPSSIEFSVLKEPGEDARNIFDRTMVYYRWQGLMSRKKGFTANESSRIDELGRGETLRLPMTLVPHRRGVIAMDRLRALLPDPLGFFQKCRHVEATPGRLVVLPKRYRLPRISMPGEAAFHIGGEETGNATGSAGEFIGLRDYRPGDPLRQIHWKSWAHTGRPVVKELEDTFYPRYALVLDTFIGSPDENVFEEMVSVAASFVTGLDRSESLLDLMFIADKAHTVTSGRGMGKAETLLEVLAGVKIDGEDRFDTLSRTVASHRGHMTSCIVILNGWDSKRAEFIQSLLKAGIICVPFAVGHGERPPGFAGHWLESGEIERDLLRLPPRFSAATI